MSRKEVLLLVGIVALGAAVWLWPPAGKRVAPQTEPAASVETAEPAPRSKPIPFRRTERPGESVVAQTPLPESPPAPLDKAERLAQLQASFRALAAGDPKAALGAARQLTNDVERETALLMLVTEWKHGELGPPRDRARYVASYGLEAGLGIELSSNPELAVLWANELTQGPGRAAVLQQAALRMLEGDPASAFALGEQLVPTERSQFNNMVFGGWAQTDTEAALQWAAQLSDAAERDAAMKAIRSQAPVGIGAELRQQDGYAVINRVLPGAPAELGGQLQAGDRIVALAQGDQAFVDARGMALKDLVNAIRGEPGSTLQLQVLSADASPDSTPRTISVIRDQVKFKR